LEDKGFVSSWLSEPTAARGGRAKRCYRLKASGERALKESLATARRMAVSVTSVGRQHNPAGCLPSPAAASWKTPPALGTKANRQRKPCPPVGPSHYLFAKTRRPASNLFANWNILKIRKIYRALAQNIAQQDAYEILTPIGLIPQPLIGSVWAANPSGKPPKSLAKVISRATSTATFEVNLNSGRPDQIRIHLASIDHPLVGDPLYGLTGQPLEISPAIARRRRIFPARPISEIPSPHHRRTNQS